MRLFHLTNLTHLIEIENDGFLEVTESNIGAPMIVNGVSLAPMVGVVIPGETTDERPVLSDPASPDFVPTVMPREIFMKMHDEGMAPRMIPPDEFAAAIAPLTEIDPESGQPVTNMRIVVGFDSDKIQVSETIDEAVENVEEQLGVGKYGEHIGPDVVWLTDDPTPSQGWQAIDMQPDMPFIFRKNIVLFTVEVPDEEVEHWPTWSAEQGILDYWYESLDQGTGDSEHWYVVPRRIPSSEWVSIHNAETGSVYWTRDQGHIEGDARFSIPLPTYWVGAPLQQVI